MGRAENIPYFNSNNDAIMPFMAQYELIMPDLGLEDEPILLSLWLAKRGERVYEGVQLVEVAAGCVTVDLPSPADGILSEKLVEENEPVRVGQRLAVIAPIPVSPIGLDPPDTAWGCRP
jgi:pyruvate dehydrogenase E2 component (dihydrolipoamide acetyltransferase)